MAFSEYTESTGIISALPDDPNDSGGLTAAQLKAKFDENAANIKEYINDTLVAELNSTTSGSSGADNTGYGGDIAVDTVKEALDLIYSAGSGTIPPDDTITTLKIVDGAVTLDKIDNTMTTLINSKASNAPYEEVTATWSERVDAGATVTKTINHNLGSVPSKIRVYFLHTTTAMVEATYNGSSYFYSMMCSWTESTDDSFAVWKKNWITSNYLFGAMGADYLGSDAIGSEYFRLADITFDSDKISFPITNSDVSPRTISSSIIMEVYK